MRYRALAAAFAIPFASEPGARAQAVSVLTCVEVMPPSDSGTGRFGSVAEGRDGRLAWTDGRPGQFLLRNIQPDGEFIWATTSDADGLATLHKCRVGTR